MANDVSKEWKKFVADSTSVEKAKNIKTNGKTLVELFVVIEETSLFVNGIVDPAKQKKDFKKWWTLAKVLASQKFPVNSIIKIPNEVGRLIPNPEYDSAMKHNAIYPNDQKEPPQRYLGNNNILVWLMNYSFVFNPLKEEEEETNYFLIPDHIIECEMDKELIG